MKNYLCGPLVWGLQIDNIEISDGEEIAKVGKEAAKHTVGYQPMADYYQRSLPKEAIINQPDSTDQDAPPAFDFTLDY